MASLSPNRALLKLMADEHMASSVVHVAVELLSVVILIKRMQSQPETWESMPKVAGEPRWLVLQTKPRMPLKYMTKLPAKTLRMGQSLLLLNEVGKGQLLTHIGPICRRRHSSSWVSTVQHCSCAHSAEIVRWVSENLQPFSIVKDRAFRSLMKTGQPHYYLPFQKTVTRDVRHVFAWTQKQIATLLRVSIQIYFSNKVVAEALTRNMMARLASRWMHGHRPTIGHMLLFVSI